ncbi:hypothetical protein [Stenotrophomonas bentonitica]
MLTRVGVSPLFRNCNEVGVTFEPSENAALSVVCAMESWRRQDVFAPRQHHHVGVRHILATTKNAALNAASQQQACHSWREGTGASSGGSAGGGSPSGGASLGGSVTGGSRRGGSSIGGSGAAGDGSGAGT